MTPRIRTLQIDVPEADFDRTLAFWAGALSATPYRTDPVYTQLVGASSVVAVDVQRLGSGDARYHLDLGVDVDDVDVQADRVEELGATRVGWQDDPDGGWWVMRDPAGLSFCVVPDPSPPTPLTPRGADTGYLDAIFVDVPADVEDVAITFWSAALGATPQAPSGPYTPLAGVGGVAGDVYVAVQRVDAPARHHVDLAAADVEVEAQRLEALGARRVAEVETWITLADPAGNLLCVVPDTDE